MCFEYVSKKEYQPIKNELIEMINKVQDKVRDKFTFRYDFVGSSKRNMITRNPKSNIGFDFDVNIMVNDDDKEYSPSQIKHILMKAFDEFNEVPRRYDYSRDTTRVFTIKLRDVENLRTVHSFDFAIAYDCKNGKYQYIHHNKTQNTYSWEDQPKSENNLLKKEDLIKKNRRWNEVRELYLKKKNRNTDVNKKSRSIYVETINEIYNNRRLNTVREPSLKSKNMNNNKRSRLTVEAINEMRYYL